MSKPNEPMFKMLLETLKNESEEVKGMFFTETEEDLLRAYQEGRDAHANNLPVSNNPYRESSDDIGKYNMNMCWKEGFVNSTLESAK
ncbi:MAG: hypothetical protein JHC33_05685 [Ignisphaera sp.]|nr:hypothetical protein [Ignisphaera sp.]